MTSIQCVPEKSKFPPKSKFLVFYMFLIKKVGKLQFLDIVLHDIIRSMYEKEECNKKLVKRAKTPTFSGLKINEKL